MRTRIFSAHGKPQMTGCGCWGKIFKVAVRVIALAGTVPVFTNLLLGWVVTGPYEPIGLPIWGTGLVISFACWVADRFLWI